MSFTSKKLHSQRSGIGYIKGATLFFLGMSCVLFMARAFDISPTATNAVQYIQRIFLTQNGDSNSPTEITLDGTNGNGTFNGTVGAATVTATTVNGTTVNGTTVNGTTLSGTNIKGTTITGSTICLANDTSTTKCRTSWPTYTGGTGTAGGGESIWSTGLGGIAYYNSGNVGIGTGNPNTNLHIYGIDPKILLEGDINASDGNHNKLVFSDNQFPSSESVIEYNSQDFEFSLKTLSAWPMMFGTNNIERMRIAANGNVGIATSTPTEQLQIGNYAWLGQNTGALLGTGGRFLRIYGDNPIDGSSIVGDEEVTELGYSAGKAYAAGEESDYAPNIQLNYRTYNSQSTPAHKYYNWKMVGDTSFGLRYSTGAVMPTKMFSMSPLGETWLSNKLSIGTTNKTQRLNLDGNIRLTSSGYIAASSSTTNPAANANQLFLGLNGAVGIGTANPICDGIGQCKFHVNGDSYFEGDTSVMNSNMGIGYNVGSYNGGGNLYVANNVGIGTTTPQAKLSIDGGTGISLQLSTVNATPDTGSCQGAADYGKIMIQWYSYSCNYKPVLRICINNPIESTIKWRGTCLDITL